MEIVKSQSDGGSFWSSEEDVSKSLTEAGQAIPESWMGRTAAYPRELSVVDFIRERCRLQPDAPAVEDGGHVMSYGELDRQSDGVANDLLQRGLRVEEPVAVMAPLSCEYLAIILGILKAGGCYFPIGLETPAKRLEFLLADCQTRFVWSDPANGKRLKDWPGTVLDWAQVGNKAGHDPKKISVIPTDPQRVVYLLYTSGSTGQPKGVQVEHHSLTNFVGFYHRHFQLTPKDRSSLLAYISFDVSVSDIWPTLCAGGTVVVPPNGILNDPDGLIRWLETREITLSFVPTGVAEILFTRSWPRQMKLRYLITGGDRLRVRPPAELPFTVINGYGPTESTVFSTMSVVKPEDGSGKPPPIGRPLDNVTAYVLDEKRQRLPVGAAGELYLGGAQLARGYLGRPELTRECFLPDPFTKNPGARMYRTGDWARWLPDGELDFLGRKDDQIQIRGYRVELGEIEALLFAHEAVKQVCCVPCLIEGIPTSVVAHIVPHHHDQDASEELRDYLSSELPEYMVPSRFILHERLPLTAQGKADRAAMIALLPENKKRPSEAPLEGGLELALAGLWRSLLPAAADSSEETSFAELGGDSLLLVRLILGVEEIIGQRLEASTFLVQPTLWGLCKAVKVLLARTEFQPVLTLRKHGNRPPLFFLYGLNGDIDLYFGLAEALGNDQPIYGIRSPALENMSRLPSSIEAAAAEIITSIRKIQPHGAPALVGYCWSGRLAFEVSRQFARTEGVYCFTAAIGTDAPLRPTSHVFRIVHFIRYFPSWLWGLILDTNKQRRRIMRLWNITRKKNGQLWKNDLTIPDWATSPITRHMFGLMEQYCPFPKSDVPMEIFNERDEHGSQGHPTRPGETGHLPSGGWRRWTNGNVRIYWLDGNHLSIIRPPLVANLAQAIRSAHDQHMKKRS